MTETATKTILLVEDDTGIQEVLGEILKAEGYAVLATGSGEEGLKSAKADKPDLIILDVLLPGLDGWQVCQQLKADPETSKIPLFFLTARDAPLHKMVGLGILNADEYIVKPVPYDELVGKIHRALKKKEAGS